MEVCGPETRTARDNNRRQSLTDGLVDKPSAKPFDGVRRHELALATLTIAPTGEREDRTDQRKTGSHAPETRIALLESPALTAVHDN